MNKTLMITNGSENISIECNSKIHTRVSEECLLQLTYRNRINPKEVVFNILLEELNINRNDYCNWKPCF